MTITFHPKAGMVLICDFRGNVAPEITKIRPVVFVTPNHLARFGLTAIVPLSTTRPDPLRAFHYRLRRTPIPARSLEVWAKCDLITSVGLGRLDRVRLAHGRYVVGHVDEEDLLQIRLAAARSLGVDFAFPGG